MKKILILMLLFALFSCEKESKQTKTIVNKVKLAKDDFKLPNYEELTLLNEPLPDPKPGDWLSEHDENGQSFDQYFKNKNLVSPSKKINIIYIQPIGTFTDWGKKDN